MKAPQLFALPLLAAAFAVTGCHQQYIPNTDVKDTEENRKIVKFCERYRRAMEGQNIPVLLSLASPKYYEDGGNVDPSDDLDYAGLREWLQGRFAESHSIRYEIRYRRIVAGENQRINVVYTYAASYKIPGVKEDQWRHTVAENRLELEPAGESFKIVAGMLQPRNNLAMCSKIGQSGGVIATHRRCRAPRLRSPRRSIAAAGALSGPWRTSHVGCEESLPIALEQTQALEAELLAGGGPEEAWFDRRLRL